MIEHGHDFGVFMDRATLAKALEDDDFRSNVLYQPSHWYNAFKSASGTSEAKPGQLLIQFHASLEGARWTSMANVLKDLVENPANFAKNLEDTSYSKEITEYWKGVRSGHEAL
jgi:hypothetical protein